MHHPCKHAMNKHEILYWYRWGNEKPGYVSTWRIGEDGSVRRLDQIKLEDLWNLPKGSYFHNCPYN
jgi:hypothetical protein